MYYLDYANGWPASASIKAQGYGGVIRYVTSPSLMQPPNPGNRKHITRAEYDSHLQAGIDVWLVYQGTTTDADGGYAIGRRNAFRALDGCVSDVGPRGYTGPIFFTNDRPSLPNANTWRDYLNGAASVLGTYRVGAYGFANAMDAAVGHATWFWQAGRRSDVRPHVHFWQDNTGFVNVGGITCDRNLVLKSGIPIPPPPPPPPPPPVEEDMQLTDVVGTVNGRTVTVRDVYLDQYVQHAELETQHAAILSEMKALAECMPVDQRARFNQLCNLLYMQTGQATWADLEGMTWADLQNARWGDIPSSMP